MIATVLKYKSTLTMYTAVLIALASAYYLLAKYHQTVGYDKAILEVSTEATKKVLYATNQAVAEAEQEIKIALKKQRVLFDSELKAAKTEQVVEIQIEEVIKNVSKTVYVNNCGKLNITNVSLLKQAVNYVNKAGKD